MAHYNMGMYIAPGQTPDVGAFEPRRCVKAMWRGSQVNFNFTLPTWDYWPWMERTLEEARSELGIVPYDTVHGALPESGYS